MGPLSPDPKPLGAFVEYTLKPLLEDTREVLELLEKQGIPAKDIRKIAIFLYIYDRLLSFALNLIIAGLVCYTALKII